ncbi:MAG: replication and repair protein RecF [Chloroflexota bacterium]|nr:replication and repair protein RecF [Chloroflexota bacterium]
MYLRSLQLTNYRNFRRFALTLSDGPTVIQGANAQGKTNLLEAIELLATTKSARAGSDRELIRWGTLDGQVDGVTPPEPFARIAAGVSRTQGDVKAEVLIRAVDAPDDAAASVSKVFRINGMPRRALEFVGEINVISFSPEDVDLVAGSPSGRRRYLDITNAQMSPRYLRTLQRYGKVLLQRNSLLRQARERGTPDPSLAVWDDELATNGAYIVLARAASVAGLSAFAGRWFQELSGWGQQLTVQYRPSLGQAGTAWLAEANPNEPGQVDVGRTTMLAALERLRPRERGAGMSLMGPHRDDLAFLMDGIDLNVYGSRGQQRLAALSLKLAEVELLETQVGSRPILLLDDVLSELDDAKQAAVLRVAGGQGQTILTVTTLDLLDRHALPAAAVYHLEAGAVEPLAQEVAS